MATIIGVHRDTLYKYCKGEIDAGRPFARAKVAQTAFQMATSGKQPIVTMFWLKSQAGWDHGSRLNQVTDEEASGETATRSADPLDWADDETIPLE